MHLIKRSEILSNDGLLLKKIETKCILEIFSNDILSSKIQI